MFVGTYNRNIHVFNVGTFDEVSALKGHIGVVTSLAVSSCEGFCFSACSDMSIKVNCDRRLVGMMLECVWKACCSWLKALLSRCYIVVDTFNTFKIILKQMFEIETFCLRNVQMGGCPFCCVSRLIPVAAFMCPDRWLTSSCRMFPLVAKMYCDWQQSAN